MKISLNWLQEYLPGPLDRQTAAEALTHGGLPVENFEEHGDDTVIDVEVTSNRSDCLSHIGVARELAALLNRDFRDVPPAPSSAEAGFVGSAPRTISNSVGETARSELENFSAPPVPSPAESRDGETIPPVRAPAARKILKLSADPTGTIPGAPSVSVRIEATDLCPHYTARIIRNIKIGPSPAWMVRRLEAVGVRPINNVVDVTNYILFEMGQPLHAFDFDKIEGGGIIVRRAKKGEKLITIDGRERELDPEMLVIADAVRPAALAGVMGGHNSEVSDQTVNILLESARFDPLSIRKTARGLAMGSDSSYRFERGIDPQLPI
ncbi:MAG TPA: phenylalanine--tRNA ligase beta subunit-related protein, partial [Humisphaera sp.]|nr:phenylalanine--tRNA ligase beta subunit-related protein [Humisphaera sp.]